MQNTFVSFFDEGSFIRVFNSKANTTTFFNKVNISIQMDNVTSVFLKNDTHVGFYTHNEVKSPITLTIDELVATLVGWTNSTKGTSQSWDLNNAYSLIELQMALDKNQIEIDEIVTNGGSIEFDPLSQLVNMSVTDKNAKVVRQSKMVMKYRLGQDILAVVSGTLIGQVSPQNVIYRIGLFEDDADIITGGTITAGCFFQYDWSGDMIGAVLRRSGFEDLVIPQYEWNIDSLNGLGPSGLNIEFDKHLTYIYELRHRQGTIMKLGVMNKDVMVFCHEFIDSVAYTPSLPVRWEIKGNGLPTSNICAGNMLQGYAIVYGKQNRINNDVRAFGLMCNQTNILSTDENINLVALRLLPNAGKCRIQVSRLQIINTETGFAKWELVLNPIGLNGNDFVTGESILEKNESNDNVTEGTLLATGYIGKNTIETIELDSNICPLTTRINGTSDIIALRIHGMYGTVNIGANISWREYI